ncbi:30S ribosomal protein S20 [Candidatus Gracilibacteria bacterium]|nr:30S ribosomal protein S20 [Candidatus Gracilibacteria bacterium]
MPVIKSAKKKARQALKNQERNKTTRTQVKTYMKKMLELSKSDVEEAKKLLPKAYKVLDLACKKHMIHKNNAAHKKSRLARAVSGASRGKAAKA